MKYIQYEDKYLDQIYALHQSLVEEEKFFKELSKEEFVNLMMNNANFKKDGTFVALEGEKVVGFISGLTREIDKNNPSSSGLIHTLIVSKEYRRQGIATKLLQLLEEYFRNEGKTSARFVFLSGINWPWYAKTELGYLHPGAPAVRINSPMYLFLYKNDYVVNSIHEGFCLDLVGYKMPEKVEKQIKENLEKNLVVEVYDSEKHYGIDEFCNQIDNPGFASSIKYNLNLKKPKPFLVASDNGKVVGWTGAMYTEATGRGHLDGICVHPEYRKNGLGKILFAKLCEYLANDGSKYMTFFTGLDNPARYIYLSNGFKVVQSFADMKKVFK